MRKYIEMLVLTLVLSVFTGAAGSISLQLFMADLGPGANAFAILMAGVCGLFMYLMVVFPPLYWRDRK